jgi:dCMP deaminase
MTVIAYVPAYHRGYATFFAEHEGPIYVIDTDIVRQLYPKAERDIRAVPALEMTNVLRGRWADVHILDEEALPKLDDSPIVMPDEDISHLFAKKYLQHKKVSYVRTHLRWDGWSSVKESPVPPDRVVSRKKIDQDFMLKANQLGQKSPDWWRQLGAIIVKNGEVIVAGFNRPNPNDAYDLGAMGDPRSNFDAGVSYDLATAEHGEAYVIGRAAALGLALEGASMYVSVFPCPTCAKLIKTAGIKKVYYEQGYSLVDAEALFKTAGIEIILVKP